MSDAIEQIERKLASGGRLGQSDGEGLFAEPDLHAVGRLAHAVRTRLHGLDTFYNVNRHINYTSVCVLRCRFCGFARSLRDDDAYTLSIEQIVEQARQAAAAGATEVHIVGGLHPTLPLDYYTDMLAAIRAACPTLHRKAFTAIEIVHFAKIAGMSIDDVLRGLVAAGLDSLPGGGAEVFSQRVHAETFRGKAGASDWFAVHRAAHGLGLPSNATMLYGHIETPAERVAHMIRLRELQDETHGFQAFVPLSFNPAGSQLSHLPGPSAVDDLRTIAVARLMLDNIPHVKTFWVMTGCRLSQVALLFGADDLDGTVVSYDITHRDGAGRSQEMSVSQLQMLIRSAGLLPVERDSRYRPVQQSLMGVQGTAFGGVQMHESPGSTGL